MRRILILTILVLMAVIAGILLIRDDWQNLDLANKTTKVGLLLNGSRSDRSFSQTHYEALESLQDELKLAKADIKTGALRLLRAVLRQKRAEKLVEFFRRCDAKCPNAQKRFVGNR